MNTSTAIPEMQYNKMSYHQNHYTKIELRKRGNMKNKFLKPFWDQNLKIYEQLSLKHPYFNSIEDTFLQNSLIVCNVEITSMRYDVARVSRHQF